MAALLIAFGLMAACGTPRPVPATATTAPSLTATIAPTLTSTPAATATAAATETPAVTPTPAQSLLTRSLGDGWRQYTHVEAGFVIEFPVTWGVYEVTPDRLQQVIDALKALGLQQSVIDSAMRLRDERSIEAALLALDVEPGHLARGFTAHSSVLLDPGAAGLPIASLPEEVAEELPSLYAAARVLDRGTYELPSGQAASYLEYTFRLTTPDGPAIDIHGYQVYVPAGTHVAILTLAAPEDEYAETYAALFDRIRQSFVPHSAGP